MLILLGTAVLATIALVVVYANLKAPAPGLRRLPVLDCGVETAQFETELSAQCRRGAVGGNRIDILNNGDEIFPAMLEAVHGAERTVNFESYAYWQGEICAEFARALAGRARAGVEVRVTLDWYGSLPMEREHLELLESAGVELEHYRPLAWYAVDRFNHRTHRRILVVDGRVGFTGGAGVARQWTGCARSGEEFRDMHFRLEGPAVALLQGAFQENWLEVRGEILTGEGHFPKLEPAGDLPARVITSAPGSGNERARDLHLRALAAARRSIRIGTPYFVPDALVLEALLAAAARGVEITVLVPGRSSDSQAARYASRSKWGELIRAGIGIFEFDREVFYHAKVMIVDEHLAIVGSTNFDSRSFRLNDEINLVVGDAGFARELGAAYEADLDGAERIGFETWRRRPLRDRLLEPLALLVQGQI